MRFGAGLVGVGVLLMLALVPAAGAGYAPGRVCEGLVDQDCWHIHYENGPWLVPVWYHCDPWLDAPYTQGTDNHPLTWLLAPCIHG